MKHRIVIGLVMLLASISAAPPLTASPESDEAVVRQFYLQHGGTPAWSGDAKAEAQARQALTVLSRAAREGLDPENYRIGVARGDARARDLALSNALLTYMRDVSVGRPDLRSLDADIGLPVVKIDYAAMLDRALRQDKLTDMLDGLSPQHLGYLALKAALPQSGGQFETLVANMERWRWLPPVLEADRIMVNAADSQLELWLAGRLVLTSRVIVGRVSNPTPILRAEGGAITINPSWTVPRSIAAREILPKLKKNPAWLAQHDMVLLDGPAGDPHGRTVNWGAVRANTFPYQIRQRPGPHNPLGRIKLELPNRFDVYLHDTPDKALFNRFKRQLSHGCVRVEQIMPVTTHVLSADPTAISRVTMAMEKGETVTIPLQSRIPVYFLYWTATAAPGEALQYHPDVYGRDRRMIAAMRGRQMRVASAGPACPKG